MPGLRSWMLVVPVALLAGCGGAGDEDTIRDIVEQGSTDPKTICAHLTDAGLKALGGKEECEKLAAAQDNTDPNAKIDSIEIEGDKATVKLVGGKEEAGQTIRFVKEDGEWRVSPG